MDEESLIKKYKDLTGTTEAGARSVFMYVCREEQEIEGSDRSQAGQFLPAKALPAPGSNRARVQSSKTAAQPLLQSLPQSWAIGENNFCLAFDKGGEAGI